MPGLAFIHVTSSLVARATACWVVVAILARQTESTLGEGQPYLVKDINTAPRADTLGYGVPPHLRPLLEEQMPEPRLGINVGVKPRIIGMLVEDWIFASSFEKEELL